MSANFHESFDERGSVKTASNRSFGLTFTAVFAVITFLPLLHSHHPRWWWGIAAALIFATTLLKSDWLNTPNRYWTKLGLVLGKIVTPVVLGVMFFVLLTPMALLLRLCGKDLLSMRLSRTTASYWVERSPPGPAPESLRNQF